LIAAELDPNAADDQGQTPLHIAVTFSVRKPKLDAGLRFLNELGDLPKRPIYRFNDIVAVLLENEASISFRDTSGRTPQELADAMKSPEEIRQLLRRKQAVMEARYRHAMFDDR
jgi:ankyrin repeat protein